MPNTWPGGHRHAMSQSDHEAWNASNNPGTRQECCICGCFTGRCEEDTLRIERDGLESGPMCDACFDDEIEVDK